MKGRTRSGKNYSLKCCLVRLKILTYQMFLNDKTMYSNVFVFCVPLKGYRQTEQTKIRSANFHYAKYFFIKPETKILSSVCYMGKRLILTLSYTLKLLSALGGNSVEYGI